MNVVRADQSIIFYDFQNPDKSILFVNRGFVQDEEVRKAIGIMSLTAIIKRRGTRVGSHIVRPSSRLTDSV
jgi:hypothetical protein